MPVSPTYPGVYIEEIPSGVRTITGVGTSVTAFVGYTQRGPTDLGVQLFNFGDFERQFGGLLKESDVSYAVQQFFLNGGSEAWVVRVASGASEAAISLRNGVGGADIVVLTATATSQGQWGNNVRLDVDYATANPASLFNLTVTELIDQGGTLVPGRVEVHRNLSMNSFSASYARSVVNAASSLIQLDRPSGATAPIVNTAATSTSGTLALEDLARLDDDHRRVAITVNGDGPYEVDLFDAGSPPTGTLNVQLGALATQLAARVGAIKPAFSTFACARVGSTLQATAPTPGGEGERSSIRFSNASIRSATSILKLGTTNGGREADGAAGIRPAQSGTVGGSLAALDLTTLPEPASLNVTIHSPGLTDVGPDVLQLWTTTHPTNLEGVRGSLQAALALSSRAVLNRARRLTGRRRAQDRCRRTDSNARAGVCRHWRRDRRRLLRLTTNAVQNVSRYALGVGATSQAQAGAVPGDDGAVPTATQIRGSRAAKSGIFALEDVDLFNILCLPNVVDVALLSDAIAYAAERRSFVLLDFPDAIDTVAEARQWLDTNGTIRDKNAAIYFPRVQLGDPLEENRLRSFPTCGVVAGIYARTDVSRGVWKAPAGVEAQIRGVQRLDYTLTDPEKRPEVGALEFAAL